VRERTGAGKTRRGEGSLKEGRKEGRKEGSLGRLSMELRVRMVVVVGWREGARRSEWEDGGEQRRGEGRDVVSSFADLTSLRCCRLSSQVNEI